MADSMLNRDTVDVLLDLAIYGLMVLIVLMVTYTGYGE